MNPVVIVLYLPFPCEASVKYKSYVYNLVVRSALHPFVIVVRMYPSFFTPPPLGSDSSMVRRRYVR